MFVAELPSGTLTFLFTDLEGSTALWEAHPDEMRPSLARHDELLSAAVEASDGTVVKTTGDGLVAVFAVASDAVTAALACQHALTNEEWPLPIKARMGLYTGEARPVDGDYHAPVLNRAARVMSAGHGGQVLLSATTAGLVRGEFEMVDLGEHQLRDLGRPEQLFQLGRGEFPALRTMDTLPGNLPAELDSFVGRSEEMVEVMAQLSMHRLVTLTGVGGVGKTRLALQVAAELLPRFEHGAWLVELAPVRDPDSIPAAVASGLGIALPSGEPPMETLLRRLANQVRLVVVDNCEHLLAETAEVIGALLGGCAGLRVLATSREGLGLRGEHVWPVPSLSDSVSLFCDRAVEVDPTFAPSAAEVEVIDALCRRLDRMPLAVELAARRVRSMSPGEIFDRIDERFRLLRGGRRRVERHQTLREAIAWSYDLLQVEERTVFDRAGVFAGRFELAAAEAVVADDDLEAVDVLDHLDSLVAKSLVSIDRSGPATGYRLLDTLRQFALDNLTAHGDDDRTRARHAHWYTVEATRIGDIVAGPRQREGMAAMKAIRPEVDAALDWLLDTAAGSAAADLVQAVWRYWWLTDAEHGTRRCGAVLDIADDLDPQARVDLLALGCYVSFWSGDWDQNQRWGAEAREQLERHRLRLHPAMALYTPQGQDADALWARMLRILSASEQLGSTWWQASNLLAVAQMSVFRSDEEAPRWAREALAISVEVGWPTFVTTAETLLAMALEPVDREEALVHALRAIEVADVATDTIHYHFGQCLATYLCTAKGDHNLARDHLLEALAVTPEIPPAHALLALCRGAALLLAEFDPVLGAEIVGAIDRSFRFRVLGQWPSEVRMILDKIQAQLPEDEVQAALGRGATLDDQTAIDKFRAFAFAHYGVEN